MLAGRIKVGCSVDRICTLTHKPVGMCRAGRNQPLPLRSLPHRPRTRRWL